MRGIYNETVYLVPPFDHCNIMLKVEFKESCHLELSYTPAFINQSYPKQKAQIGVPTQPMTD